MLKLMSCAGFTVAWPGNDIIAPIQDASCGGRERGIETAAPSSDTGRAQVRANVGWPARRGGTQDCQAAQGGPASRSPAAQGAPPAPRDTARSQEIAELPQTGRLLGGAPG